jgi:hypothetical protein
MTYCENCGSSGTNVWYCDDCWNRLKKRIKELEKAFWELEYEHYELNEELARKEREK